MGKDFLWAAAIGIMAAIQPDALIGAACGTMFFLMLPIEVSVARKFALSVFSFVSGYLAGIASGDHAGWVALVSSSLSVVAMLSAAKLFTNNGFRDAMELAIEVLRTLKK